MFDLISHYFAITFGITTGLGLSVVLIFCILLVVVKVFDR